MVCQFYFFKKLKVKLWYCYLLVSGSSLGGCFGLSCAPAPPFVDLCPIMGVTQPWNVLGCTATCGALDLPSSLGSSSPFATPGALSACSSVGEKLLISELGEETGRPKATLLYGMTPKKSVWLSISNKTGFP